MADHSKNHDNVCKEEVFDRVYRENARLIGNFLYYKFGNQVQADDIRQEAFVKLWENCAKVPLEKVKNYLFTIAANLAKNVIKHQGVILKFEKRAAHESTTELEPEEDNKALMRAKLQKALSQLPEKQRTTLLLNRMEGLTYKEIAAYLNISEKAVEKRMHKALMNLKKLIEGEGEGVRA